MRKNRISITMPCYVIYLFIVFLTASCINTKNVVYFNNLPDSLKIQLDKLPVPDKTVQVNDVLEITIGGENETTVHYIQTYITGQPVLKATVDIAGNIELPKVGKIHVAGLLQEAAKDAITNAYKEYLIDPIVQVKLSSFHYTILGEVKAPGIFDVEAEKITLFEAIGKAGDLTPYAERENIKIIRDVNGEREVITLNMLDKAILNSPDYYIQRYDIIYVEPKNIKQVNENIQRFTPYISIISGLLAIIVLITRN
ncbi:polysaccharide export protein [Panacibacter ginsenosidivorans]|uniref:Polysaccharide export protein n=1 Tax=Panacibacter ginsenosidivorans TaxID=1813871 RepID=A0A5B8VC25_9BACT|nr:polysaccharide biosynthesis/export family protein [Panacibacter ginsenosidivorans]QEC69060.1 polysaccharide export protein [Panacibacter ginsenosidivorans]